MSQTSSYKKVFVVGCPRSGTSWAANMLGQHPNIVKLMGETHLYKLFYDPLTYLEQMDWRKRFERKAWIYKHYGIGPILTGFNSRNMWAALPRIYRFYRWSGHNSGPHTCIGYEEFLDLFRAASKVDGDDFDKTSALIESILDTAFYKHGGDSSKTLLEKTPMHIKYVDVILSSFPEAKVVEVVRDVRGVCASWQARAVKQKWANKPTPSLVDQWKRGIELGEKFRSDPSIGDRILKVHYEDLKQNTAVQLKTMFDFLEQPITQQESDRIAAAFDIRNAKNKGEGNHVRKGMIGAWKTDLSETDITTCNQIAGPLLEKIGYSIS